MTVGHAMSFTKLRGPHARAGACPRVRGKWWGRVDEKREDWRRKDESGIYFVFLAVASPYACAINDI